MGKKQEDDAWKQYSDLFSRFYTSVKVREDLIVEALGVERTVRFTLKTDNPNARGPFSIDRWFRHSTQRNVSTMRELAQALLDACDFVDASNPQWASKHPSVEEYAEMKRLRDKVQVALKP